jgi:hypothetical protein
MVIERTTPRPDNGDRSSDDNNNSKSTSSSASYSHSSSHLPSPRADLIDLLAAKVAKVVLKNADTPIQNVLDTNLPKDDVSVRALPFYQTTLDAIRFQRDQYIVGTNYAKQNEKIRKQRQQGQDEDIPVEEEEYHRQNRFQSLPPAFRRPFRGGLLKITHANATLSSNTTRMPFDATALGYIQIVNIGQSFIPSPTIKNLLLPIVIDLPNGALREPIINVVANALPLAQPSLDRAVKYAILNVMDNPTMRQVIKNRTQRILRIDGESTDEDSGDINSK